MPQYRCACGSLIEYEEDEGDCEDDEVQCPKCGAYSPIFPEPEPAPECTCEHARVFDTDTGDTSVRTKTDPNCPQHGGRKK